VFNKYYTVLDSCLDFQPKIKEVGAVIVKQGVQIVYLIAMLYLNKKEEFK
jgi:hypothetical protein